MPCGSSKKCLNCFCTVRRGNRSPTEIRQSSGFPVACFGHAGDGNIHVNVMVPDIYDPAQRERADAALDRLFKQVIAWGGAITGEHGIGIAKSRWFGDALDPGTLTTHHRLKAALDPNGTLNPGKFLG